MTRFNCISCSLVLISAMGNVFAQETPTIVASPHGVPLLSLPNGWSITISSRPMKLNPSPATGLPAGQVFRPFELTITVRERLSEEAQTARVKKNQAIRAQLPHSKVIPPEFRHLQEQLMPEADFYDDHAAYEIDFPGYLPDSPEDRQAVVQVYEQLRRRWKVYPSSRHADDSYYATLLESGVPPKQK